MIIKNIFTDQSEITHDGAEVLRLIRNDTINAQIATYNYAWLNAGRKFAAHQHQDCIEFFLILSGAGKLLVNSKWMRVKSGDFIEIPAQTVHSLHNDGEEKLVFISLRALLG